MKDEYIMIGDCVESLQHPGVIGMVTKILYGDDDPALIYILKPYPRGCAKSPIVRCSLKHWKKIGSLRSLM